MQKINNINYELLNIFSSDNMEEFIKRLNNAFLSRNIDSFRIWDVEGNICEPCSFIESDIIATFDIYELGYKGENYTKNINLDITYFDIVLHIDSALFLKHGSRITNVITFEKPLSKENEKLISEIAEFIGIRASELSARERQMDLYIDYQKKVDFVKRASIIFKALEIEEVISVALNFFMEVFSSDAVCAIYNDKFYGIGLEEYHIDKDIFISNQTAKEYLSSITETHYTENCAVSSRFNIKNTFFVCDSNSGLKIALFNIIADIVPDKEFSSLVSSIVSIAVENALNHQKITKFKIEETEIQHTAEILNKFVKKSVSLPENEDIYGISYPARNAGGDFIKLKKVNDDYLFCVADVCGKGYSAAVLTVVLSVFMYKFSTDDNLAEKIIDLNKYLISKNFSERFITGFFGIYRSSKRELEFLSCGHDPVAVISPDAVQYLGSEYMPMGIFEEDYKSKKIQIKDDSIIFVYTDGLTEYADLNTLVEMVKKEKDLPSKTIAENLYKILVTRKDLQRDDFTCLIMKV